MRKRLVPIALLALWACAPFPEVDGLAADADLPMPALVPLADLAAPDPALAEARGAALAGQAARLKAEAAALRAR